MNSKDEIVANYTAKDMTNVTLALQIKSFYDKEDLEDRRSRRGGGGRGREDDEGDDEYEGNDYGGNDGGGDDFGGNDGDGGRPEGGGRRGRGLQQQEKGATPKKKEAILSDEEKKAMNFVLDIMDISVGSFYY